MRRRKSYSRLILVGLLVLAFAFMLLPTNASLGLRSQLLSALRPALDLFSHDSAKPQVMARNAGGQAESTRTGTPSDAERQLRAELARLFDENQRLRQQLRASTPAQPGLPMPKGVAASIIAREVLWEQSVFALDRGTLDGSRAGSGVLYQGVAVGKVVAAAPRASCFAPLTHPETRVAVRLTLCRAEGLLLGGATVEGRPACLLKIVAAELNARVGEWVVTSGLDGSFPAGCWVGEVASIERRGNLEWAVTIRPSCEASELEAVYLLTEPPVEMPRPVVSNKR